MEEAYDPPGSNSTPVKQDRSFLSLWLIVKHFAGIQEFEIAVTLICSLQLILYHNLLLMKWEARSGQEGKFVVGYSNYLHSEGVIIK